MSAPLPPVLVSPARCGGLRFAPSSSVPAAVPLPSLAALSRSACRWGASSFSVRPSSRAASGFVAVVGFRACWGGFAFSRFWALRVPRACRGVVCRVSGPSGRVAVSVPVCASSVPAAVLAGGSLSLSGSPPAVRRAFLSSPAWLPAASAPPPPPSGAAVVAAAVAASPAAAFCGSRRVAPPAAVLAAVAAAVSGPVLVGCVGGLCAAVRGLFPSARVFRAAAFGSGASSFVRRSVALVRAAAAAGACWVSFPASSCPPGLRPSSSSGACFCGSGSGSWASLCFAVGLGLPAFVWLPPAAAPPSWLVPLGGGWFRAVRPVPPPPAPLLPGF